MIATLFVLSCQVEIALNNGTPRAPSLPPSQPAVESQPASVRHERRIESRIFRKVNYQRSNRSNCSWLVAGDRSSVNEPVRIRGQLKLAG